MTPPNATDIWTAAMDLSRDDRMQLATLLLESLETDEIADDPASMHHQWMLEIRQRIESADKGDIPSIPWEEARRMIIEN